MSDNGMDKDLLPIGSVVTEINGIVFFMRDMPLLKTYTPYEHAIRFSLF